MSGSANHLDVHNPLQPPTGSREWAKSLNIFEPMLLLLKISRPTSPVKTRPIALENSILRKLPPELIICIADFLPPAAAASFALCCEYIYSLIGSRYQEVRGPQKFSLYEMLELLERDTPDHILCYYCEKLHPIKHAEKHVNSRCFYGDPPCKPEPTCWKVNRSMYTDNNIHRGFSFTVFQMAMKRYRQGADCSSLLALLSSNHTRETPSLDLRGESSLALIVNGSLLLRTQVVCVRSYPPDKRDVYYEKPFKICPHFGYARWKPRRWTGTVIKCSAKADLPKVVTCGDLIQCKYCATEFRFDFKDLGDKREALALSRWKDLGEGRSPEDHQWINHVTRKCKSRTYFRGGSICGSFDKFERGERFGKGKGPEGEDEREFMFDFDSFLLSHRKGLGTTRSENENRAVVVKSVNTPGWLKFIVAVSMFPFLGV